jgi:uncharacterized protein
MASNLETTKKAYELFGRGDISTLVKDIVDATCTWIIPGPQNKLPWAGNFNFKGRKTNGQRSFAPAAFDRSPPT